MLTKLYIRNFALIDCLEFELYSGFNVLTGETGAGKSIIIDAVDIVLGGQGLTEFIRSGEEKALVEGFFQIEKSDPIGEKLEEYGLAPEEGLLILTRELVKSGKNLCRINGRQVNLSVYREIAANLVDIYGQHHQHALLDQQNHIRLLDEYAGAKVIEVREKTAAAWRDLVSLRSQLQAMEADEKDRARSIDMFKFQIEDIDKCQPKPDEDLTLEEEKNILAHAEKLTNAADTAYQLLYEGGHQQSVTELLHNVITMIKDVTAIDESLQPLHDTLETALYQLEDTARELRAYAQKIEADPQRLEQVEARINNIRQLKKKYGETINEILQYREQVSASLSAIANYDEELVGVKNAVKEQTTAYENLAKLLTERRLSAAAILQTQITGELQDLNMPHVTFQVQISVKDTPSALGQDDVEFLISPNKGEPLKPLVKIVSGGEVSRIMLAFKAILAGVDSVPTLIFDEVDAGIGGYALQSVARKLSLIGEDRQVICVTHSAQLAGQANHHYHISKSLEQDRTVTRVKELSSSERVQEVARMLAGGQITDAALKHAEEILKIKD